MVCVRSSRLIGIMAKLIAHGANVSAKNKVIEKFIGCTKPGFTVVYLCLSFICMLN